MCKGAYGMLFVGVQLVMDAETRTHHYKTTAGTYQSVYERFRQLLRDSQRCGHIFDVPLGYARCLANRPERLAKCGIDLHRAARMLLGASDGLMCNVSGPGYAISCGCPHVERRLYIPTEYIGLIRRLVTAHIMHFSGPVGGDDNERNTAVGCFDERW